MFKSALPLKFSAIAATVLTSLIPLQAVRAQSLFKEADITPKNMVAVAVPLNSGSYNLLVIEQFDGKKQCWAESGLNPTAIDPLLLNFDFTGNCRRSTDSNGYSMRINGEDLGLQYMLQVKKTETELLLVAVPGDRTKPQILLGRSDGLANGFLKLNLLSGWKFTRRTYQDKPLGHFYFSSNGTQLVTLGSGDVTPPDVTPPDVTPPDVTPPDPVVSRFTDITSDIYRGEIDQAVAFGFIAGFNDNTFRPTEVLTREQLVSMAIEGLAKMPNANIQIAGSAATSPYPDVAMNRWSAAKIAWARANNIVSGYPNGTFRPTQPVTRAELLAVMRRTAEYAAQLQGKSVTFNTTNSLTFTDTSTHWSKDLATQMSSYCRVASPYNEAGDRFFPDRAAQRNYAAAATLRTLQCVAK